MSLLPEQHYRKRGIESMAISAGAVILGLILVVCVSIELLSFVEQLSDRIGEVANEMGSRQPIAD